jgi:hypothetical protein
MSNTPTDPHFDNPRPVDAEPLGDDRVLCGDGAAAWGAFHDMVDQFVVEIGAGDHLDLTAHGAPWTIRVSAGWPGVDGPGTVAHHLQVAGRRVAASQAELEEFATTPYAMGLGYAASRVAADLAAMGLEWAGPVAPNPSVMFSGPSGGLEAADMLVELLREVFAVGSPACVEVTLNDEWPLAIGECAHTADTDVADLTATIARSGASPTTGEPARTDGPQHADATAGDGEIESPTGWWSAIGYTGTPTFLSDGHVVGSVGDVLVEVERDADALPGLDVIAVRARVTDPEAAPLRVPAGKGFAAMRAMGGGNDDITLEPVRTSGHVAHAWAHRMVVVDAAPGRSIAPADETLSLAAAVGEVVAYVSDLRWADPDAARPVLMVFRPA